MIRVVIGTEPSQLLAERVLEYSIRKNTAYPIEIHCKRQVFKRVGGTQFGFVRFSVPQDFGFSGKAIYLDADQLVFGDIGGLWKSLQEPYAIAVVQNAQGTFGGKPVGQHNQTSVMVMDCSQLTDWKVPEMFSNVVANDKELARGQIHYRDFMMLAWMNPEKIQALDPRWNHFNFVRPDSNLVHFSYVRQQPWKQPKHPLAKFWMSWLKSAVRDGAVDRQMIVTEVLKRHVHPWVLTALLPGTEEAMLAHEYA